MVCRFAYQQVVDASNGLSISRMSMGNVRPTPFGRRILRSGTVAATLEDIGVLASVHSTFL